jgi:tRNA 2-thiouridine synthesizing protein B
MLHIVNKTSSLPSCLRLAQPGQTLLLIEDGVYAATRADLLGDAARTLNVHALQPDLAARGMAGKALAGVKTIDYTGFVELVATHPTNQSWL